MEKINIAEILKDCPKGMELYSPIFGDVYLDKIRPHLAVVVSTSDKQKEEFLYDGRFGVNGECMLFPSKENRDWSTFQRPFNDGDIVYIRATFKWIAIYKELEKGRNEIGRYASIRLHPRFDNKFIFDNRPLCHNNDVNEIRLATEEEKQKLFDAIKENGFKWNPETKTLEKLITLNFKIGDKIRAKGTNFYTKILGIKWDRTETYYETLLCEISVKDQDKFELVPSKFDITTFKPFDKVLVRDSDEDFWSITMYSHYAADKCYPFVTILISHPQCIPYEGNQHLLGTTNDCDEYYKTWE